MHDPMTVAWELKRPWPVKSGLDRKWKYYPAIATVWHVDPERDGSDDSCGWSSPRLTANELKEIESAARFELKYWFDENPDGGLVPKVSAEAVVYEAFQTLAWRIWKKQIKPRHLPQILSLTHNHIDNFSDTFRGRWGKLDADDVVRSCYFIGRAFKRMERPWYRHPRYHFWHFKFQVPLIQNIKRFLWGRCGKCGKGLGWNKSVVSHSWDGEGPQWFRSERNVECYRHHGVAQAEPAAAGANASKALNTLGNE